MDSPEDKKIVLQKVTPSSSKYVRTGIRKLNVCNFFSYVKRETEVEALYALGRACRENYTKENYQKLFDYLKTLNNSCIQAERNYYYKQLPRR